MSVDFNHSLPPPAGFSYFRRYLGCEFERNQVQLLVPNSLADTLSEQEKALREEEEAQARQRAMRVPISPKESTPAGRTYQGAESASDTSIKPVLEPVPGKDYNPRKEHPVFSLAQIELRQSRGKLNTPDRDAHKRDEDLFKQLRTKGSLRKIATPVGGAKVLAELRRQQPHFHEVVDLVAHQLALAKASAHPLRIPPLLLIGEAGVGKTHFAMALAKALGAPVRRQSYDNDSTAAALMGSERKWASTHTGVLFDLLCLGDHANPILILDEIDKAGRDMRQDPLAPLHTLLEPSTSGKVRDISVEFEFDASLVIWIATANRPQRIPQPLRSRFREFWIELPGAEQALEMAGTVMKKVITDLAVPRFEPPGREIVVQLAHLTPRELYQATEQAVAAAVTQGRRHLKLSDLPANLIDECPEAGHSAGWLH